MPIPTIIIGQSGFGLDGTFLANYLLAAGKWEIVNRHTNTAVASTDAPNGWAVINSGGRLYVTPPAAATFGGWYRAESKMGAGNAQLSAEFFAKTPSEAATSQQIVRGVASTVLAVTANVPASGWSIRNADGVQQASDNTPVGWSVTALDGPGVVPRRVVVTCPTNAVSADQSGWFVVGPNSATRAFFDITLTAPVVPPPSEQFGQGVEIRVYDKLGKRRRLPSFQAGECNWTIEPSGGYGDFSLTIAARPDELTSISAGDRLEIFKFGTRQFRGYVSDLVRSEDEPASLTLSGYGRILDLERMILSAVYQRAQPTDLADLFAEVSADIQSRYPGISIETQQIGVSIPTLDCRNKSARQALSDLCNSAPSACHWGFDVDDQGRDRLYLRKIDLSAADTTIVVPGANVGQRSTVLSLSDVINAVIVQGGTPSNPQLLPNGSFEVLAQFSDDSGGAGANLLLNPSFENGSSQNSTQNWTLSGGASIKFNGGQEANAYSGNACVELDQQSEKVGQVVSAPITPIVSGRDYTFGVWSRAENNAVVTNPSTSPAATATVSWRDASGNFVVAGTFVVLADVSAWKIYERTFRAPQTATGFKIEFEKTSGSVGANRGMLLDSAAAYDNSSLISAGFGFRRTGTAVINASSWAARGAYDGRNCLYLSAVSTDTDNNDIHVRLTPDYRITVVGGQKFRFQHRYKGVSATSTVPKQQVQWQWYKADGSKSGSLQRSDIPAAIAAVWTLSDIALTAPGDATQIEIWIAIRGSGEILLDALSFRDAADAADSAGVYLPEGNFQARYLATDLVTAAENAEVNSSIATYGLREAVVSVDGVSTFADAKSVARGYLISSANGMPAPSLSLYDDKRDWRIGTRVRLSGRDGAAYSNRILPTMRINGSIDGNGLLTHNLELVKPILNDEELLSRLMESKARSASSTVAVNSAASTSIPTGSSSSGGGSTVAGVESVNGAAGAITVAATGGITASTSGTTITLDGSGITSAAGVTSVNSLSGAITLTAGTNTSLTTTGNTITINATATQAAGYTNVNRNLGGSGENSGVADNIRYVITDTAITTLAMAWTNPRGGNTTMAEIWCARNSNLDVYVGSGNVFLTATTSTTTITLTPNQTLKCVGFLVGGSWQIYYKIA